MILGLIAGAGFWALGIGFAFDIEGLMFGGFFAIVAALLVAEVGVYRDFRDAPEHLEEGEWWSWPPR